VIEAKSLKCEACLANMDAKINAADRAAFAARATK